MRFERKRIEQPETPPKLSLFSFPTQLQPEPLGMRTPPVQAPASVPFYWEYEPGKPKPRDEKQTHTAARCLELPPRLSAADAKSRGGESPTTVLGGPQVSGRSLSFSFSFRKGSFKVAKEEQLGGYNNKAQVRDVGGGSVKVTTAKLKRKRCLSRSSRLLVSIYEGFKQVMVPWRNGGDGRIKKVDS